MPLCPLCGTRAEEDAKFCPKCGGALAAGISELLRDIEFGPVDRKTAAIATLRQLRDVDLSVVQPALEKVLGTASDGSLLRFYAACTLAYLGDDRDVVANAIAPYMSRDPFEGPHVSKQLDVFGGGIRDNLIHFPWAENAPGYLPVRYERRFSPQITAMEAFGYMRGNALAAQALDGCLDHLDNSDWRLFAVYAAGANGHSSLRPRLEYLRDRSTNPVEREAAGIALERFGTSTILEIAQLHDSVKAKKADETSAKSGCFIATAAYGTAEATEVKMLRRFRDFRLLPHQLGRVFLRLYCVVSPPIARFIQNSKLGKAVVMVVLLRPAIWLVKKTMDSSHIYHE